MTRPLKNFLSSQESINRSQAELFALSSEIDSNFLVSPEKSPESRPKAIQKSPQQHEKEISLKNHLPWALFRSLSRACKGRPKCKRTHFKRDWRENGTRTRVHFLPVMDGETEIHSFLLLSKKVHLLKQFSNQFSIVVVMIYWTLSLLLYRLVMLCLLLSWK